MCKKFNEWRLGQIIETNEVPQWNKKKDTYNTYQG